MKKVLVVLLTCVLLFLLVSCASKTPYIGENGNWWIGDEDLGVAAQGPQGEQGPQSEQGQPIIIDLFNCEVGDELPVNPNCTFNCRINDVCTIENLTIKATLIRKTEINEGDVIAAGMISPFVIEIRAEGTIVGYASAFSECILWGHLSPSSTDMFIHGTVQGNKIVFVETYKLSNSHFGSFVFTGIKIGW